MATDTFRDVEAARAWLDQHNGQKNIYFHVNPCLRDLKKKAEREDVEALAWLHVDIDPRVGEDLEQERERALRLLTSPPQGVPPPTVIVFSGGGYQGFWKLAEPFPIGGDFETAERAKLWNLQLEIVFGADHCHNVDRIMRLPGTINLPDAKKAKKGRVPTLAALIEFHEDRVYPLSLFTPAQMVQQPGAEAFAPPVQAAPGNVARLASVEELNEWQVPDRVKALIVQGNLRELEGPKEGDDSRSAWLFDAVCQLVRCNVPDDTIYAVITDPDFGISESVLDKGSLVERYAMKQIAAAKEHAIDPRLREFNGRFAVIGNIGGRCRVVEEQEDPTLRRSRLTLQSFADFRNRWMNKRVDIGEDRDGNPRSMPLGDWWLHHENRRQYDRIVFSPEGDVPNAYNLWKGFAFEARPGDATPFLEHLEMNLCQGNRETYEYLVGWMARVIQQPASPGQVAVVLRGPKGTGKGFFANHFGRLLGRHYMQVADPKFLVGSFNSHLRDCVLLFGDEAFYAGDKKHESVLKTLITEDMLTIEAKGVDAEASPNFVHLILASNEEWVVPAGPFERRFFVLDVGDGHQQDVDYFRKIDRHLRNGGYQALLHYLLTYDLSRYEVRTVPATSALQDQKILSLSPLEEWWLERLSQGRIANEVWPKTIMRTAVQQDYILYARDFNVTKRGCATRLGHFLSKICPTIQSKQGGAPHRNWIYHMPSLDVAREHWEEKYGKTEWPAVDESVRAPAPTGEPF